jgi:hypothetical protein
MKSSPAIQTQRAMHRMCIVFRSSQDDESENPRNRSDEPFALSEKALFFGSFLFGQKKK